MEATACFKNLILKVIHDAVSYAGDTNHPWSMVRGDNTGAQARRWLPWSSACGPLQWPPSPHCSPNHLASLITLFPWLTVTPQRQDRACRSLSSTFQCLPWPKRQSPIDECGRLLSLAFPLTILCICPLPLLVLLSPETPIPSQDLLQVSCQKFLSERPPLVFCLPASQG